MSVRDALGIYAEPLVQGARVVIVGATAAAEIGARMHELGARSVHAYDPSAGDLDVREGAFDLAIVPDLGRIDDPSTTVRRLRRVVGTRGAIVAMARARTEDEDDEQSFPELAPAAFEYAQLYDLFALQFEDVSMAGVLPFAGVVFAQLGNEEEPAVSVDTRLGEGASPGVFVIVASQEGCEVDPYAIVQTPHDTEAVTLPTHGDPAIVAALAAAQLRANLLATQLEQTTQSLEETRAETRAALSKRGDERVEAMVAERNAMIARGTELETIVATQQQALATLERRLVAAEQQLLERDDRNAALQGELDSLLSEGEELAAPIDAEVLLARAEKAESALALHIADLAHVAEAHATETAALEAQLRERARVIASMEKELARREHLVKELVGSLADSEEGANGMRFEATPPVNAVDPEELGRLRRKIDELAMEIARRDGELVARDWRAAELEARARPAEEKKGPMDEIDALRQALAQEHAARVAAESGEELSRARAELARQAALLDQMREVNR
jgi:hypothetical protein